MAKVMQRRLRIKVLPVAFAVCGALAALFSPGLALAAQELTLTGHVDHRSYEEIPFEAPAGVRKINIDIDYSGHDRGAVLVFSVFDPQRIRGWNGGLKPHIVIGEDFATPSFMEGPLPAGRWRLGVGVANIRPGETTDYTIKVRFSTAADADAITENTVRPGAGWYRGDLHAHTGHSDAYCANPAGRSAPCPLFLTLQAAFDHHLDFIAVTDHNVASQYAEMADLAAYFDTLLLIPGREITTQEGHFNLIGATRPVNFLIGSPPERRMNDVLHEAAATGGLVIINHPEIPTGEDCLGCGWSAKDTDFGAVTAIEVANGGIAADHHGFPEGQGSGLGFWERQLNLGRRLTGTGGSDNHNAIIERQPQSPVGAQSPVGIPATVVYAEDLSQAAILNGIRSGRVFVDLENTPGRILDLAASTGDAHAVMGGVLQRGSSGEVILHIHAKAFEGDSLQLVLDGHPLSKALTANDADQTLEAVLTLGACARWVRVDARNLRGERVAISNPIYLSKKKEPGSSNCNAENIK